MKHAKFLLISIICVLVLGTALPAKAFYLEMPEFFRNALQSLQLVKGYAQEAPPPITEPPPPTTPPPGDYGYTPPPSTPYTPPPSTYTPPPTSSCTPPPSGCSMGTWNQSNCMCEGGTYLPPPSTCTPPYNGCGSGMIWNQSTCSCNSSGASCTAPMSGCGMNSYWDMASCSCHTTGGCTAPSAGCGMNSYWDSSGCMCKPTGAICTAPMSGCGMNSYWDSSSCMCKTSGASCVTPMAGCGSGMMWDQATCTCKGSGTPSCGASSFYCEVEKICKPVGSSCQPQTCTGAGPSCGLVNGAPSYPLCENGAWRCPNTGTQCTAPMSGCGMNSYWDQSSCICKSNYNIACSGSAPSCASPSYSVCENGAWRCSKSGTQCTEPPTGCGGNNYWDQPSCMCKMMSGQTQPYQPQPYPNQQMMQPQPYQQQYQQPEPMDEKTKCIKGGGMWCGNYCSWGGGKCEATKTYQMPTQMPTQEMGPNQNQMNNQDQGRFMKDMQRGAKDMERGVKQFENLIKQMEKKGTAIPQDMKDKVAQVRDILDKIKAAKSVEDMQDLDMSQMGDMMMELDNTRRDLENNTRRLDDVKRNIKNAEQQIKMFEKQLSKAGSCVSGDVKDKLATLKQSIAAIKNAKTWEEVESAGLEDMGDLFMSLDENRQVLEVCSRWPQMSKEMDKTLKNLNSQLKNAKTITARLAKKDIDISSQYASFEAAVQKMQSVRDEVKSQMAGGDAEGAMELLQDGFFGQMDDVMQYASNIQMVSGVGQFTAEFKKGITQSKSQIKKLARSKIDVTELNDILAEAQRKGNEILAIMKAGNFDADEVFSMIEDMQQIRQNFDDKVADLTGTEREIMPWETGKQIFNKVEMPTFLNPYIRAQETQKAPMGPNQGYSTNPVGESNPSPAPYPAPNTNPVGESNPQPSPSPNQ